MKRQAFVNWERVTEDNIPESGKEYMVAEIMGETVAKLRFATWYNEGDIVSLQCKTLRDINEMTMEERLLQAIFGATKDYVVPKAGFYLQTADFGIDENTEDGAFADCKEMMIKLEEHTYFAEKPLVPEGFLSEEQERAENLAKSKQMEAKAKEDVLDKVKFTAENDGFISKVVKSSIGDKDISYDETIGNMYKTGFLNVSTFEIAKTIITANNIINGVVNVTKAEGGKDKLIDTLREAAKNDTISATIKDIAAKHNVEDLGIDKQCIVIYLYWLLTGGGFYYYRNKFIANRKYDNVAQLMVKSYLTQTLMVRLGRCALLREMGAPEIINLNELRMFANILLEYRHIKDIEIIEEGFAEKFGVNMDGSEFSGLSDIGNFEKETPDVQLVMTDENGEEIGEPEEEEEKEEPIDRYCIVDSPNFKCLEGYFALYNPKLNRYYRADGENVSVYKVWKDARDVREEINK